MLVNMCLYVFLKIPLAALAGVCGRLELSLRLSGKIVHIVLPKIMFLQAQECKAPIMGSMCLLHVSPTVLVTEKFGQLVKHHNVIVFVRLRFNRCSLIRRLLVMWSPMN